MALYTSTKSGDWSDTTVWDVGGSSPSDGDHAVIANGHTVDLDSDITVGNDDATPAIDISGILQRTSSANDWTLTCKGDISVNDGGEFNIDMSSNAGNWQKVVIDCATTDKKYDLKIDSGGKADWDGADKLHATQLNDADAAASDTDITVDGDITGWQVDDELVIEGDVAGESEKVIIASIAGQVVTIDAPGLVNQHDDDRKVVNITRNVKFCSANASYRTFLDNRSSTSNVDIKNVEGYYLNGTYGGFELRSGGSFTYSSVHDSNGGIYSNDSGVIVQHNIIYSNSGYASRIGGTGGTMTDNYYIDCSYAALAVRDGILPVLDNNYICDSNFAIFFSDENVIVKDFANVVCRANSADIRINSVYVDVVFYGPTFSSATLISNASTLILGSEIKMEVINDNDDDHRSYLKYGNILSTGAGLADTEVRTAGSLALKMTPNDTDNALEWEFTVPCVANEPMAVTGYLMSTEDCSGDTEPFITISGCGMTPNTYTFDTATNEDSWEQFVIAATPTRNGLATVKVSVYKNAGNAPDFYIDDIVVASTAIDLGRLDYWYKGLPAPILLSTGIGALDIWKTVTSNEFGVGSMGEALKSILRRRPK